MCLVWPQVHTIGFYPLAAGTHNAAGATHRGESFLRALAALTSGTYREYDATARFQVRTHMSRRHGSSICILPQCAIQSP
jgi:hypothetical protein